MALKHRKMLLLHRQQMNINREEYWFHRYRHRSYHHRPRLHCCTPHNQQSVGCTFAGSPSWNLLRASYLWLPWLLPGGLGSGWLLPGTDPSVHPHCPMMSLAGLRQCRACLFRAKEDGRWDRLRCKRPGRLAASAGPNPALHRNTAELFCKRQMDFRYNASTRIVLRKWSSPDLSINVSAKLKSTEWQNDERHLCPEVTFFRWSKW